MRLWRQGLGGRSPWKWPSAEHAANQAKLTIVLAPDLSRSQKAIAGHACFPQVDGPLQLMPLMPTTHDMRNTSLSVYVYIYRCICIHMRKMYMCIHIHIYEHACMYMCMHKDTHAQNTHIRFIYMCIYIYVCKYLYTYTHACSSLNLHVCPYVRTCVRLYVCLYVCMHAGLCMYLM